MALRPIPPEPGRGGSQTQAAADWRPDAGRDQSAGGAEREQSSTTFRVVSRGTPVWVRTCVSWCPSISRRPASDGKRGRLGQ